MLSSDIVESQSLDLVLNAEDLDLKDNSVRSLFAKIVFIIFPTRGNFSKRRAEC